VKPTGLGFVTDIALLERAGSTVEDRGDHLVVRTRANPSFYWGNFLLLDHVPEQARVGQWIERFENAFPDAAHKAFGFDVSEPVADDASSFVEHGLRVELSTVMTAGIVRPPPHPNEEAVCRAFESDRDWSQSVELQLACYDADGSEAHREFVVRRAISNRALATGRQGRWFGAFIDERLVAQMGLISVSPALARFQSVETHPDYRRRGLAGTLAHHAGRYGFGELGAETLVIVADPNDAAIRIYRNIGFSDSEMQLQAEGAPALGRPEQRQAQVGR
jgi:ribosomal protein S18 acetylase RimI-like enzyme